MKKSNLTICAFALIAGTYLSSCSSSAEKVENAQDNVDEANQDLNKANQEYMADIEKYKKETEAKIAANNKSITDFNSRIDIKKREANIDYQLKIKELEDKNSDMKKTMDDYKAEGKEQWEQFKAEFSHDMDELGDAFIDFTKKQ